MLCFLSKIPPASNGIYLDSLQPPEIFAIWHCCCGISTQYLKWTCHSSILIGIRYLYGNEIPDSNCVNRVKLPYKKTPRGIQFAIFHYTEHQPFVPVSIAWFRTASPAWAPAIMTVLYFPILLTNKSIEKIVQCNKFLNQYLQPTKLVQKGCVFTTEIRRRVVLGEGWK